MPLGMSWTLGSVIIKIKSLILILEVSFSYEKSDP